MLLAGRRSLIIATLALPAMAFGNAKTTGFANPSQVTANVVEIIGPKGRLLVYVPSVAAGNLLASISGVQFTDEVGNTVYQGICSYATGDQTVAQLWQGSLHFFSTLFPPPSLNNAPLVGLGAASANNSALVLNSGNTSLSQALSSIGLWSSATQLAWVQVQQQLTVSHNGLSPATQATLDIQGDSALGGTVFLKQLSAPDAAPSGFSAMWADLFGDFNFVGNVFCNWIALSDQSSPPAAVSGETRPYASSNGNLSFAAGGDSNDYSTGVLHEDIAAVTITAITPSWNNIGPAIPVSAQKYKLRIDATLQGLVAGGIARMQLVTPATSAVWCKMFSTEINGGAIPFGGVSNNSGGPLQVISPIAVTSYGFDAFAEFTFTAAGTIQLQGNTSAAGDNWAVNNGSMMLYPVG